MNGTKLYQDSEIAPLRWVVVHEPGAEVEQMTPATAGELLYNDIVPGEVVRKEHRAFRRLLERYTEVEEITDLLIEALRSEAGRAFAAEGIGKLAPWIEFTADSSSAEELARVLVEGVQKRSRGFAEYFSPRHYDLPPLPNLYFMRDSAFVFRNTLFLGSMAHKVREGETMLTELALRFGGRFEVPGVVEMSDRIEGGDIAVLSGNLIVAGLSQRTSPESLDRLASEAAAAAGEAVTVIGVVLPSERSTIHLDMVFTQIDEELALVHERTLSTAKALSVTVEPGGATLLQEFSSLREALRAAGKPLEFIRCGGDDPVSEAREQWLAAANTFALAPGAIITFEANSATNSRLEKAGFTLLVPGEDALPDPPLSGRYAFTIPGVELARGGGGPRCMTLPVVRTASPLSYATHPGGESTILGS
ncbi:MAG: arginine deiminase family protein [Alkalispirochaetaceae bacterium]